jgi:Cu(I)/Ag(I) efflux system membrane fusion protein
VRLAAAQQTTLSRSIHVPGIVRFDESRWTDITLRLEGYVRDLYVDRTGQAVRRGQPLFAVYSPDLASALAEYRLAVQSRTALNASASAAAKEQAGQLVEAARLRLARWQVTDDQIDAAPAPGEAHTVFRSPVSGIVMEKTIVRGMRVMPGDVLYRIVDPSIVWVEASVYEPDLGVVHAWAARDDDVSDVPRRGTQRHASPMSRPPWTPKRGRPSCGSRSQTLADGSRRACSRRWI